MNIFLYMWFQHWFSVFHVPKSESKLVNFEQNLPEFFYWHLSCGVCPHLLNPKQYRSGTNIYIYIYLILVVSGTIAINEFIGQFETHQLNLSYELLRVLNLKHDLSILAIRKGEWV